jgi:hypothetical protein
LIAAARGSGSLGTRALEIISDTDTREFISSEYVRFETVPKPTYFGNTVEVRFYEAFFSTVAQWFSFDVAHLKEAFDEACRSGVSGVDAIHVVVAALAGCHELVTSEKPTSSIHRTTKIRVVSIDI